MKEESRRRLFLSFIALQAAALAACGGGGETAAPPAAATSALAGTLRGPVGAQVTLQANGGGDLAATVLRSAGVTDAYDATAFSFATRVADASAYSVTLKTSPAGFACQVYRGASGTMPVAAGALRVGCERDFDHVSRSTDDRTLGTYYDSYAVAIGGSNGAVGSNSLGYGEGRFIVFASSATIAGASGARRQIFWRDRMTNEVRLVSASAAGAEGNGDSANPVIAADGLSVAFESAASNLVAGDDNGVRDVFVWSALSGGAPVRASVGAGGAEYTAPSGNPTLSGDGKVIAFETLNSNLTSNVAGSDSTTVVVRRDLATAATTLISRNLSGGAADSFAPSISEDGKRIAFYSFQSNLVTGDTNGLWDIFVADTTAGTLRRVSLTSTGGERNQGTESASRLVRPVISGDGRWVAYATTASNVVPGDTNGLQDVFVVDTQTGAVTRASTASNGTQADADAPSGQGERLSLSYDGTWVAFTSSATNLGVATTTTGIGNVFLHNRVTGETRAATANTRSGGVSGPVGLSRSGAYLVFGSSERLDARFASSGWFARFTGIERAFYWLVD